MCDMDTAIILLGIVKQMDIYGYTVATFTERKTVYATVKSVKQSEFYNAAIAGTSADLIVRLYYLEYDNQKQVEVNGVTYRVLRTYRVNSDYIELTLTTTDVKGSDTDGTVYS